MSNAVAIPGIGGRALSKLAAGEKSSVAITAEGIRAMIQDLRKQGHQPASIALSKRDRRDLNDDLMAMSSTPVAKDDQKDNQMHIAVIEGVLIGWNRNVENGKCVVIMK